MDAWKLAVQIRLSALTWAHSLIGKTAVSKTVVAGSNPAALANSFGEVAEWLIAPVSKIGSREWLAGSNPALSSKIFKEFIGHAI